MAQAKSVRGTNPILQRFYDTVREECIPSVESATVALVAIQDEKIVHDRTGVLYRVGSHHFILTASHAGQDEDHDLRRVIHHEIPLYVAVNADGVLPISLNGASFHGTEVEGRDIAIIRLPEDVAKQIKLHKRFVSHKEIAIDNDCRQKGIYFIVGYPEAWSLQRLNDDFLYSDPLIYECDEYSGQVAPDLGYRHDVHLLLGFDRNAVEPISRQQTLLPEPFGISGCGVWRIADHSREGLETVCKEKVSLVGIQNRWNRERNYLRATRIKWVLARILGDYPELEQAMKLVYPRNTHPGRIVVPHMSLR